MKLVSHPRSLFHQLLLFFGIPLIILGGFTVYTHYYSAKNAADQAYDSTLLAAARTISDKLTLVDGHIYANFDPQSVLKNFQNNLSDRMFYQVIAPDGKTLSGSEGLPAKSQYWLRSQYYTNVLVFFYNGEYQSTLLRVAAFFHPMKIDGREQMVEIRVAETVISRHELAYKLVIAALMSQGTVVFLTLVLAYILLKKLLTPLKKLSTLMLRRSVNELTPIPNVLPWSELSPLVDALNRYVERLKRMVKRQERFSADASHQLKTPLTVLKTQVSVALNSHDEPQIRQSLYAIDKTLDSTIALTDRLLQLSRLKAHDKKDVQQYRAVNLADVVQQACFSRLSQSETKFIDLGYEGLDEAWIKGEPILLAEMCANLLDNAIKYTPEHGIITARIIAEDNHQLVVFEIEDSGPGIPDEKVSRSMEAFTRLNNAQGKEGAGLGLALVKDIASYHGSTLQLLKSEALGGLLVRIVFAAKIAIDK